MDTEKALAQKRLCITSLRNGRLFLGAILMDLSKAFDTVNHKFLVAKLNAYGFSKEKIRLIFSYLNNRKQRVKINKTFSSWREYCMVYHMDLCWN